MKNYYEISNSGYKYKSDTVSTALNNLVVARGGLGHD